MCICTLYVSVYACVYDYRWVDTHREMTGTINMGTANNGYLPLTRRNEMIKGDLCFYL